MSYIIPDARFEMPELFEPGRKPVGNVQVDWEHPLAHGLISYGIGLSDLVYNTPVNYYSNKADRIADYLHFNDTRNGEAILLEHLGSSVFDGWTEGFMYVIARIHSGTAASDEHSLMGQLNDMQTNNGSNNKRMYLRYDSANNRLDSVGYDTADRVSSEAVIIEDDKFHLLGCLFRGGKIYSVLDGVVLGAGTSCGALQTTSSTVVPEVMGGHKVTSGGADSAQFDLKAWGIYDRGISDVELASLNRNPYQFLIPA